MAKKKFATKQELLTVGLLILVGIVLPLYLGQDRFFDLFRRAMPYVRIGALVAFVLVLLALLFLVWRLRPFWLAWLKGTPVIRFHREPDGTLRIKCPRCGSPGAFTKDEGGTESFTCQGCGETLHLVSDDSGEPPADRAGDARKGTKAKKA
jgi:hypothetical protein